MDEVSAIIKESVETVIGGNAYTSAKVNGWTAQVVESVLGNLSKLNKTFKYIGKSTNVFTVATCYLQTYRTLLVIVMLTYYGMLFKTYCCMKVASL